MRVLELGSYIIPAYAGMILAEQGHQVVKWTSERPDPVVTLDHGGLDLWAWINHGKTVRTEHATHVMDIPEGTFDIVVDNIRASTWLRWGVDPDAQAQRMGTTWVSMRADVGERSFDVIAQARAWGDSLGLIPAYLGDTAGGLWLAFKALSAHAMNPGRHHVIYQAATLAKLVEGELVAPGGDRSNGSPWDAPGTYGPDEDGNARVVYRGETLLEPPRDDAWRLQNLRHSAGRFTV